MKVTAAALLQRNPVREAGKHTVRALDQVMSAIRPWRRGIMLHHNSPAFYRLNNAGVNITMNILQLIARVIGGKLALGIGGATQCR